MCLRVPQPTGRSAPAALRAHLCPAVCYSNRGCSRTSIFFCLLVITSSSSSASLSFQGEKGTACRSKTKSGRGLRRLRFNIAPDTCVHLHQEPAVKHHNGDTGLKEFRINVSQISLQCGQLRCKRLFLNASDLKNRGGDKYL